MCPSCGIRPPYRDKQGNNKGACPECKRARAKERHATADPDLVYARYIEDQYGLTVAEYNRMAIQQDLSCAICGGEETHLRDGKVRRLSVDHDHRTGTVRGLLCSSCNTAIGLLGDRPSVLRSAADYLEQNR